MTKTQLPSAKPYPFAAFEAKWQAAWEGARIFHYEPPAPETPKWYIMELPPFANGQLHLGHVRNYVMGDVSARYRRMRGFLVMYTSGFDSFGLPNELAAIEAGVHPAVLAEKVMARMRRDFVRLGLSHDTRRVIGYHVDDYTYWVQWVFLRLLEHGTAYRKNAPLPWCPKCQCTLADSLCEGNVCWRCKHTVETRTVPQWFIRESDVADEMLTGLGELPGWPAKVKKIHTDWIGRREGFRVRFHTGAASGIEFNAFLPSAGLLQGVAAILISPDHPLLEKLLREHPDAAGLAERVASARRAAAPGDYMRSLSGKIQGSLNAVDTGFLATQALLEGKIPVIVVGEIDLRFQDGLIALCPSKGRSDQRLAEALGIVAAEDGERSPESWEEELVRSGSGERAVQYRLRDWNIARQRYWGPPVPVIHCSACGPVLVPDRDLPVRLPDEADLSHPNPLSANPSFTRTVCPRCGAAAERDTDTLEAYSSPWWYRWNCKGTATRDPFDAQEGRVCMPVDLMIGGDDQIRTCFFHVRMIARVLHRIGVAEETEPVERLLAIGMVKSGGRKMSKSEGNAVDPFLYADRFGADALRFAVMAAAAPDSDVNWEDAMVTRAHSFLASVWDFFERNRDTVSFSSLEVAEIDTTYSMAAKFARQVSTAVARTTESLENHFFHLAADNLTQFFERMENYEQEAIRRRGKLDARDVRVLTPAARTFVLMLSPLCPHIAEELWLAAGGSGFVAQAPWPADERQQINHARRSHAASAAAGGSDC